MGASLDNIVDVSVSVSNPTTIQSSFNLGCIIGPSSALASTRAKVYRASNFETQMVTDGFQTTDPEYIAASLYFSQSEPSSQLVVGYHNAAGDSETPAAALAAVQAVNSNFWAFCFVEDLDDTKIQAVAAAVEASTQKMLFIYQTDDSNCLVDSQTNILKTLMDASYQRSVGFYATDTYQTSAALVGLISGFNTMEDNSAYDIAYKTLVGITPVNITDSQLASLQSYNGNAYMQFGTQYSFVYTGISANGYHVDEVYLIDVASYLIQQRTVAGLTSLRKVPQTEDGLATVVSFVSDACNQLSGIGLIASGIWNGSTVKNLNTGDAISDGFYVEADSIASQSAEDRQERVSPPIYVCLLSSGALEHIVIRVYVNR